MERAKRRVLKRLEIKGTKPALSMTRTDIELLFEYDRWANARVFDAVATLSDEQYARNLGGGHPSLRDTLVHFIGGEWIWLEYWRQGLATEEQVKALVEQRNALFAAARSGNVAAARERWDETEKMQIAFIAGLAEEALHARIAFRGADIELAQFMLHLPIHSTYHRGQISLMLRQLGATPLATDFHVFLLERGSNPT
jgi:uncharacterized damage-inducible protein DinB